MKKLDLTGRRFGRLTVLRPAENIGRCTAWVCRCGCGQETVVRTLYLQDGRTKDCGCGRETAVKAAGPRSGCDTSHGCRHDTIGKRLDLTGQRFGKLTVLRPAEDLGGYTAWVCRCDCGQETIVRTSNLRGGRTGSCGCQRRTKIMEIIKTRKNNTGSVAGVKWLPDKQQWKATICFNRKCYYLGTYPKFEDAANARERAEKVCMQAEENLHDSFLRELSSAQAQSAGG